MAKKFPTVFRDGYVVRKHIKAQDELHGSLTFSMRPMLAEDRDELLAFTEKNKSRPKDYTPIICEALAQRIQEWDAVAVDADGRETPAPIDVESLRQMQPTLFDRLYWIVLGARESDPLPDATEEEESEYIQRLRLSSKQGISPGDAERTLAAKN